MENKKRRSRVLPAVVILLAVVLAAAAAAVVHYMNKGNFLRDEDVEMHKEVLETETEIHPEDVYDLSGVKTVSEEETGNTYTLLVIGGQSPEAAQKGELREDADAVIIMCVSHTAGKVYFCSISTQTYADIPEVGGYSLGNAYAVGGGPLLLETIEHNYGIHIDNYASVSLKDVAEIIQMPEFSTIDISESGLDVVEQLVYQMGVLSPGEVAGYISKILPYVTHNIDQGTMLRLIMQVPKIVGYYSEKEKLPYDGLFREIDGYLVPDIGETSARLQEQMYGSEEPST